MIAAVAVIMPSKGVMAAEPDDEDASEVDDDVPAAAPETVVVVKHKRGWFREDVQRYKSDAPSASISALTAAISILAIAFVFQ